MNKNLFKICRVLVFALGLFLLAGTIVLRVILAAELPYEVFSNYIHNFDRIYYSVVSYDLNVLIWFLVPFADLFIIFKLLKSSKEMKGYLWAVLFIYTSFFVLRLTTFSA